MDRETLIAEMQAVVAAHGPWGSHNLALPYGLFTISPEPRGDNYRTVKFLQLVADLLQRPIGGLRVLDLGCGEGLYALEFAQHGAEVLGVEGRLANVAKAEFGKRALGLANAEFVQGDVRELTAERLGQFDVVLCSGLLYHLDQPAVFELVRTMRAICRGVCLIDASIAQQVEQTVKFDGRSYGGLSYREHADDASPAEREANLGASLDNTQSFWITRHDLANLLADVGFSSVFECLHPAPWNFRPGRVTLAAMAGREVRAYHEVGRRLRDRRWPPLWGTLRDHPDEAAWPRPAYEPA